MSHNMKLIICTPDEETARNRVLEWYAEKGNLTITSVEPSPFSFGGYQVSFSFDDID